MKLHEEIEVDSDEDWADTEEIITYVILHASLEITPFNGSSGASSFGVTHSMKD